MILRDRDIKTEGEVSDGRTHQCGPDDVAGGADPGQRPGSVALHGEDPLMLLSGQTVASQQRSWRNTVEEAIVIVDDTPEYGLICSRFKENFGFRPSYDFRGWPSIREPEP
ncbi:hypothetical protein GCM10010466_63660 [Planomonospora alba]|uniref:Response regulatory domain-containing protein n=1 Tax=Planomonospora alba TaxID=161354 RepID=A0ABP6P142_9ACTN